MFRTPRQAKILQTFNDVPLELRQKIEGYQVKISSMAIKEKMNDVQLAYIRYYLENETSDKVKTLEKAKVLIQKGVQNNFWAHDFCPSGAMDFYPYMKQKL